MSSTSVRSSRNRPKMYIHDASGSVSSPLAAFAPAPTTPRDTREEAVSVDSVADQMDDL